MPPQGISGGVWGGNAPPGSVWERHLGSQCRRVGGPPPVSEVFGPRWGIIGGSNTSHTPFMTQGVGGSFEGVCVNYRNPAPRRGEPRVGSASDVAFPVDPLDPVDPVQNSARLIFTVKKQCLRASRNSEADLPVSTGFHRFRNIRCRTDPGFPTPGVRITVV